MEDNKIYTEQELLAKGFYWVSDGDEDYLQFVENEEEYITSDWHYAENVGEDNYIIKKGF